MLQTESFSFTAPRVLPTDGAARKREIVYKDDGNQYKVQKNDGSWKVYTLNVIEFPADNRIKIVFTKNSKEIEKTFTIPPKYKKEIISFLEGVSVHFDLDHMKKSASIDSPAKQDEIMRIQEEGRREREKIQSENEDRERAHQERLAAVRERGKQKLEEERRRGAQQCQEIINRMSQLGPSGH